MALATRELELILIARDNASAVIARVGGAMAILGGAITAAGLKGVQELSDMAREAMDFRQQIALAVTQADGLGATIDNVAAISNSVGTKIPVPFEDLNNALYDIFSTFTSDQLSSLDQAQGILEAFAKSAVAGQAPIEDIGRSTIAWINALDQPATIENVNRLLDIQFEMVRKGAGTYGEFAAEVGKSIPAFTAAGQTAETYGGIMAFLTKNGLDAAMASTSAARAVELLFSPKALKGLKAVGVETEDSAGNFRNMTDIIRDLIPHFADLTDAQKKIEFKEIFGTGRIQARRFFDLALNNFAELEELIGDVEMSSGLVGDAFSFMMDQPLSKLDLFRQRWEEVRRSLGERFTTKLVDIVFPKLEALFDWWDSLDENMKDNIATWLAWGAAITVATGAIITLLGFGLLFTALLKSFSGGSAIAGLAKLLVSLGWIGVVLAAIAGIALLVWKNWDKIWPKVKMIWDNLVGAARRFYENNKEFFETMWEKAKIIWEKIKELGAAVWEFLSDVWTVIWAGLLAFWERWGDDIMATAAAVWEFVKGAWVAAADFIIAVLDFFIALFKGDWSGLWEAVKAIGRAAMDFVVNAFGAFWEVVKLGWKMAWDAIKKVAGAAWDGIKNVLSAAWDAIKSVASDAWNGLLNFFKGIWNSITRTASDTINGQGGLLEFFQLLPGRILEAVANFGLMLIGWMGSALGWLLEHTITLGADLIVWFIELPGKIINAIGDLITWLWDHGDDLIRGLWNGAKWAWDNLVLGWFRLLKVMVTTAIPNTIEWLYKAGERILRGLYDGIMWAWRNLLLPWFLDIKSRIKRLIPNAINTLYYIGRDILQGLWNGMKGVWNRVAAWLTDKVNWVRSKFSWVLGIFSPSRVFMGFGENIMKGLLIGLQRGFPAVEGQIDTTAGAFQQFPTDGFGGLPAQQGSTQTFQFGDIISNADPIEIAQEIAWEVRMA